MDGAEYCGAPAARVAQGDDGGVDACAVSLLNGPGLLSERDTSWLLGYDHVIVEDVVSGRIVQRVDVGA